MDFTNAFDRTNKGTVFPLTRAATMGYAFGDRRFDDGDCTECSVCNQIAPDCLDGPHGEKGRYKYEWGQHLRKMNGYNAGSLTRRSDFVAQRQQIRNRAALG